MKTCPSIIFLFTLSFLLARQTAAQGTFQNLNFEMAAGHVPRTPTNSYGDFIDPALAFPAWTIGGNYTVVGYNTLSLGASAVILMGPNFPNAPGYTSLQGSYSALLQYFDYPSIEPATLSQTGLVPSNAQSINFLTGGLNGQVTLGGIPIALNSIGGGRLAGDVSSFAGITATLTFSGYIYIDDIQFSSSPIPEPSGYCLIVVGILFLRWRNSSRSHH
jgi:hypothetical protein